MTRITVNENLASQLSKARQPVELCDATGKVIGRFDPVIDMSKWEAIAPEPTEEELDEIERSIERTYSTEEVIKHLEGLS